MGYASYPNPSFGYFRGVGSEGPLWKGQGSMAGPKLQGLGIFSQGQGKPGAASDWDPSVAYLFLLVIAEMIVFGWISRALR
jgi:hypothetical protein